MRRSASALVVLSLLAVLPSCGAAPAAPAASSGVFNAADAMFAQMMIPHHRQGIEMAELAETRAVREEVRSMAAAIEATQDDEIEAMTGWLSAWGQPMTAAPHAHDAHGGLHETSPDTISALRRTTGADFELRFLNSLIAHQHNAIDMARTEVRTGRSPDAVSLARRIDGSRSAQIKQMLGALEQPA